MAILLQNNLDVGPAGTTISVTNSDDNGDDPFDAVDSAGSGAVCRYVDAAGRPGAAYAAEFASAGASRSPSCDWTTSLGSQTHFWVRLYARFNTTPPSGYDSTIFATYNGSTVMNGIAVSGNDPTKWILTNLYSTSYFAQLFFPYTVTVGEWVRIEAEFSGDGVGAWTVDATLNSGDLLDSEVVGLQCQLAAQGTPGPSTVNGVAIGYSVSHSQYEPVQVSAVAISLDGWIGPTPRQVKGVPGVQPNFIAPHSDLW